MAEKRLVALGDILGFGNLVLHEPVEKIVDQYFGFFSKALTHAIRRRGWPDTPSSIEYLKAELRVGVEWFSDTVVLYSLDDSDESCAAVAETAAWLSFVTVVTPLRMRFGIDYGEMMINRDRGVLVGPFLVVADRFQKAQRWSGGAFTEAAVARLQNTSATEFVVQYAVPVKSEECSTNAALNWPYGIHMAFRLEWSKSTTEPPPEYERQHPDIVEKWRNTRAFHDAVCRTCSQPAHGAAPNSWTARCSAAGK